MMYYKNVKDGFIISLSTNYGQIRISKPEYDDLMGTIRNTPAAPEGYCYMLRDADLQWELVEMPPDPEPVADDPTADEVLDILLGGEGE